MNCENNIFELFAEEFDLNEQIARYRGTKQTFYLNLVRKATGDWIKIPVMLVSGAKDGKLLLADACCHGDEYEGAEGIIATFHNLNPADMEGAFVGIPAVNLDAFGAMNRYSADDFVPVDMNRAFPGNETGTATDYLSHFYFNHFIKKADGLITMHGGGNTLYLTPVVCYPKQEDEVSEMSQKMAWAMNFDVAWEDIDTNASYGLMDQNTYLSGIPVVTAEIGGQSVRHFRREEDIARIRNGLENVMRLFRILPGEAVKYTPEYRVNLTYLYSNHGGIHKPLKKDRDRFRKGEILSEITDIFGNRLETVRAPFDGVVVGYLAYSVVHPKSWIYLIGKEV